MKMFDTIISVILALTCAAMVIVSIVVYGDYARSCFWMLLLFMNTGALKPTFESKP